MSRPSTKSAERLERLEGAAGILGGEVRQACTVSRLRLAQLAERAPGEHVEMLRQEIDAIDRARERAHMLVREVLASDQKERSA